MQPDCPLFGPGASSISAEIGALFLVASAVGALLTGGVFMSLLVFSIVRRAETSRPAAHAGTGTWTFTFLSTALPLAVVLALFFWSARIQANPALAQPDGLEVRGIGRQWVWSFEHEAGPKEFNALHVPVNVPIELRLNSQDILHRFSVPAFHVQQDVLPGRETILRFRPTREGAYHLFCTEYCGAGHADMAGTIYVLDPIDYEHWVIGNAAMMTPEEAGEMLIEAFRCQSCHAPDGGGTGPSLVGRFGSEAALEDGSTIPYDAAYVRESILEPKARLAKGYQPSMTSYKGQLDESQIAQIVAYLESLSE